MLTAETQKGFIYYHCTNGKGNCDEHKTYLKNTDVDQLLSKLFLNLKFDEEFIEISYEAYKARNADKNNYAKSSLTGLSNELNALTDKESRLVDGYVSQLITEVIYKQKKLEIENQRATLNNQIKEIQAKDGVSEVTLEQIKDVFLDGSRAAEKYLLVDEQEKRNMLKKLLSNAYIQNQKVTQYQFKSPYQVLALSPKNSDLNTMRKR